MIIMIKKGEKKDEPNNCDTMKITIMLFPIWQYLSDGGRKNIACIHTAEAVLWESGFLEKHWATSGSWVIIDKNVSVVLAYQWHINKVINKWAHYRSDD